MQRLFILPAILLLISNSFALAAEPTDIKTDANAVEKKTSKTTNKANIHASPEACFSASLRGGKTKDYALVLSCFTETIRNQQVGFIAYNVEREAVFRTKKSESALVLLKKHGLEKVDIMGLMQIYDSPGGEGAAKAVELVGEKVKDHPQFVAEANDLLNLGIEETKPEDEKSQPEPVLSDVKIIGNRASGKVTTPELQESVPVFFIKEKGSWLITSKPIKDKTE